MLIKSSINIDCLIEKIEWRTCRANNRTSNFFLFAEVASETFKEMKCARPVMLGLTVQCQSIPTPMSVPSVTPGLRCIKPGNYSKCVYFDTQKNYLP